MVDHNDVVVDRETEIQNDVANGTDGWLKRGDALRRGRRLAHLEQILERAAQRAREGKKC